MRIYRMCIWSIINTNKQIHLKSFYPTSAWFPNSFDTWPVSDHCYSAIASFYISDITDFQIDFINIIWCKQTFLISYFFIIIILAHYIILLYSLSHTLMHFQIEVRHTAVVRVHVLDSMNQPFPYHFLLLMNLMLIPSSSISSVKWVQMDLN